MRSVPRLLAVFTLLSSLAMTPTLAAHSAPEQAGGPPNSGLRSKPLPDGLRELHIVRSSRTDVPPTITVPLDEIPERPTRVLDHKGADRLMRNEGVSLQWIGWEERGPAWVAVTQSGHWTLLGGQKGEAGASLDLEGFITEIGENYFIYEGTIKMFKTPDPERFCNETRQWRFEVTQNRSYYRLREFEWCDGLTDYIDIYFPPALK